MKDYNNDILKRLIMIRPHYKKRAIVTNGFPYGNKSLHCGHISLFFHSDFLARFLRDRIGKDNVIYQSSTDCYGSPILEGYRKKVENKDFSGTIQEFVEQFHDLQQQDLNDFNISTNIFSASAVGIEKPVHEEISKMVFEILLESGSMEYVNTLQFYDEEKQTFLNGRQVVGRCPVENCTSEHAYADECDMGHQYTPQELLDPISVLSGKKPIFKESGNWYFNTPDYLDLLKEWVEYIEKYTPTRKYMIKEIKEFLKKPEVYIKQEYEETFEKIKNSLPDFTCGDKTKSSFTIIFDKLKDREKACDIMTNAGIRFRTGKTLTPFRITGSIEWGVPVPDTDKSKNLTFYVWPESLWAQISITKAYLKSLNREDEWIDWWLSKDTGIYQMIGEDNMYFYGPVQMALWLALQGKKPKLEMGNGHLQVANIIANKHTLFMGNKASSSSEIKPPMASELLEYYTPEQLKMHFLSMNVGNNSCSFSPKAFDPNAKAEDEDPVTREYSLLTNVFNRVLRRMCYAWQKDFDGVVPFGTPNEKVLKDGVMTMLKYEKAVMDTKFHMAMYEIDNYIRNMNKYWAKNEPMFDNDKELEKQTIINTLHMVRVMILLLHPIASESIENLVKFLKLDEGIFSWDNEEKLIYDFMENPNAHRPNFLEPRQDFFTTKTN